MSRTNYISISKSKTTKQESKPSVREKAPNPKAKDHKQQANIIAILEDWDSENLPNFDFTKHDVNKYETSEALSFLDPCVTPLIYCAYVGNTDAARELLKNKLIDVDLECPNTKDTPLIVACMAGNYEMVRLLLDAKAEVNKPNIYYHTPLISTCFRLLDEPFSFENKRICFMIAELLVQRGADLNWILDKEKGYPLLHVICTNSLLSEKNQIKVAQDIAWFLIEKGADVKLRGFNNKKLEELLAQNPHMVPILDLLIKKKDEQESRKMNKMPLRSPRLNYKNSEFGLKRLFQSSSASKFADKKIINYLCDIVNTKKVQNIQHNAFLEECSGTELRKGELDGFTINRDLTDAPDQTKLPSRVFKKLRF